MMASKGKCVLNFDIDYSSAPQFIVSTAEYKDGDFRRCLQHQALRCCCRSGEPLRDSFNLHFFDYLR